MNKLYTRINWENEPSILTPLNEINLNKMDYAIDELDNRVISLDTSKAQQSDLLQSLKDVDYRQETGKFTFTWNNGTTFEVDLDIEKIPVSFSMDSKGIITMETEDGEKYTADVGSLIKYYGANNSARVTLTETIDSDGKHIFTPDLVKGSITEEYLDPDYRADIVVETNKAIQAAKDSKIYSEDSKNSSIESESWAIGGTGTRTGEDTDNAKYYAEKARAATYQQSDWNEDNSSQSSFINNKPFKTLNPQHFEIDPNTGELSVVGGGSTTIEAKSVTYDNTNTELASNDVQDAITELSERKGGILPKLNIISEPGSNVTVTDGIVTLVPAEISSGLWECDVTSYGTWEIHSVNELGDAIATVNIDTVKIYTVDDSHFNATITVTFPTGATCKCEKDSQIYYATTASPFTFSVHSTGIWTISAIKDGTTESKTVNIVSDGQSVNVEIKMATIKVSVDPKFIGETLNLSYAADIKTWVIDNTEKTFAVNFGTWVATIEISGKIFSSKEIVVNDYTEYSATVAAFDFQGWLDSASITKSFSSLDEVLEDEITLRTLFTKHASVDYLVSWLETDAIVATQILNTDLVAKWVNLRDYALDALYARASVKAVMDSVDKYGYGEWVKVDTPLIPTLTENNSNIIASTIYSTYYAWKAFNGDISTFTALHQSEAYLGYKFDSPQIVRKVLINQNDNATMEYMEVQGLNGSTWEKVSDIKAVRNNLDQVFEFENDSAYQQYRIKFVKKFDDVSSEAFVTVAKLQLYTVEWQPKGNVPIMTSNNAPYGEVFSSSNIAGDWWGSWHAFATQSSSVHGWHSNSMSNEWLAYDFVNPIEVKRFKMKPVWSIGSRVKNYKYQASNDKTNWIDLTEILTNTDSTSEEQPTLYDEVTKNAGFYKYYRFFGIDQHTSKYFIAVETLQLYGRELSVSVPTMTSNTEPWGECSANHEYSTGNQAWVAFNGNRTDAWSDAGANPLYPCWVQYKTPMVLKTLLIVPNGSSDTLSDVKEVIVQGSNDNNIWHDIIEHTFPTNCDSSGSGTLQYVLDVNSDTEYEYHRLYIKNGYSNRACSVRVLNFFGLDYSEHEERHWIYDHGVELEEVKSKTFNGGTVTKKANSIYVVTNSNTDVSIAYNDSIDLTNYKLIRGKADAISGNAWIAIMNALPTESISNISAWNEQTDNVPNNCYIDVSSYNETKIEAWGRHRSIGSVNVLEWWLE